MQFLYTIPRPCSRPSICKKVIHADHQIKICPWCPGKQSCTELLKIVELIYVYKFVAINTLKQSLKSNFLMGHWCTPITKLVEKCD